MTWDGRNERFRDWHDARNRAQARADLSGQDQGIEFNAIYREFVVFGLPAPANRYGFELACEVVCPSLSTIRQA